MKTQVLMLLAVGTLLLAETPSADAVSMRNAGPVHTTRSYGKIDRLLRSVERDVRNDLASASRRENIDSHTARVYRKRMDQMRHRVKVMSGRVRDARNTYRKYHAELNSKNREEAQLLASLRRQRQFIAVERRYINKMEREALGLRRYTKQYKAIRVEIRQMRAQVNKEIRDVENAYRIAKRKLDAAQRRAANKRGSAGRRGRKYRRLLARYDSSHKRYKALLKRVMKQSPSNKRLINGLKEQLKLLAEIRSVLSAYRPGRQSGRGYEKMYKRCISHLTSCRQDYNRLHSRYASLKNHYAGMNCTAMD